MADDDSRSEDAEKRPGKSSKPSKKSGKSDGGKAEKKADKPEKAGKADKKAEKPAKDDKSSKVEKKADKDKAVKTATKDDKKEDKPKKRRGPLRRLGIFIREIVEQLRKVVYPTRKQLLTYTAVVLVFVSLMIAIIYGLDAAMAEGVTIVFGGGDGK